MIGLVVATASGRRGAERLAMLGETRTYEVSDLAAAWRDCDQLVCFLATGAVVRLIAPLLKDKESDPGVVCVDEAQRFAIALTGGHGGGANALADQIADVLAAQAVISTATDGVGIPGLDTIGWPVEGDVAGVSRALLDGEPVRLVADATWPLPPLAVGSMGDVTLRITDRLDSDTAYSAASGVSAVLRPPSLVLGIGTSRGVSAAELDQLVDTALAGLSPLSVTAVASVHAKADEPGLLELCSLRGWPLVTYPADELAAVEVPNPSPEPMRVLGTPSVAEAAALLHSGGELVVEKTKSAMATVAIARRRPRGRLALVGLGPGARDLLTPRAREALRSSAVWVGLDQYVDQVRDLARPGTTFEVTGLGQEEERAHSAVRLAQQGFSVALLGSGDAGVYAMASPALEAAGDDIDVVGIPGVTAALAASSLLGAPLGHDHASISLSDLHTPWEAIEQRIRAVAEADLVVTFYNPRSRGRDWQLPKALSMLLEHRPATTPVGIVTDASRPAEQVLLTTLGELDPALVTMLACVVVGSSQTRLVAGRMVTPRGYRWHT